MYYGLTQRIQAFDIVDAVVDALGGGENAKKLLLETAMQETKLGAFRDPTEYCAGTGICQHDEMPFYDIVNRTRERHLDIIKNEFGIDMEKVKWRELENSPLLSFLACRLHYKLIPLSIPGTIDGRAAYWKKYYNTVDGKGTEEEYIRNARKV